jgi:hypothetical protein
LLDGQHRLLAIIASGKTVSMGVVTGADKDVRKYIDTGAVRGLFDRVTLVEDWRQNKIITQLINQWGLVEGGISESKITPEGAEALWDKHQGAMDWVSAKAVARKRKNDAAWIRTPVMVALCVLFERDEDSAATFLAKLNSITAVEPSVRILREYLFRMEHSGTYAANLNLYQRSLYAMKAYLGGRAIARLGLLSRLDGAK